MKFVPSRCIMLWKLRKRESEAISNSVDSKLSLSAQYFKVSTINILERKLSKIFLRWRICLYSRIATNEILDLSCPWFSTRNLFCFSRGKGELNNSLANKYPLLLQAKAEASLLGLAKSVYINLKSQFSYHTQIIVNHPDLSWSKLSQFTDTDSYMYTCVTLSSTNVFIFIFVSHYFSYFQDN